MTQWKITALIVIAFGIGLRLVNLDQKPYWMDEAFTSLRVAGYRPSEVMKESFTGQEIGVADLQKYQRINPDRGVLHTVLSLAASDPQHPPFYFILARLWAGMAGDSPTALRALSVIIGIFVIPAAYWLCWEMFRSPLTAWLAMLLAAVSPFHFVYAQEARPYGLLALMTLASSAAMLRAARLQKQSAWRLYALTVVLGLYTHLGFLAVLLAQFISMLFTAWKGMGRGTWIALRPYARAAGTAFLIFLPWLIVVAVRFPQLRSSTGWMRADLETIDLVKSWIAGVSSLFVDVKYDLKAPWSYPIRIPILLLIGFAVYHMYRNKSMRKHPLVLALIACTAIPLMVPDLIVGGRRSAVSRYWVPAYIGLQIAVAHLLATRISNGRLLRRRAWQAITGGVIGAGAVSCAIIVQADTWRNKGTGYQDKQLADTVNQANQPLLIGSCSPRINLGHILSLTHMLNERVRLRLTQKSLVPPLPRQLDEVFVLNPSEKMRRGLEGPTGQRTLVHLTDLLWRLEEKAEITGTNR